MEYLQLPNGGALTVVGGDTQFKSNALDGLEPQRKAIALVLGHGDLGNDFAIAENLEIPGSVVLVTPPRDSKTGHDLSLIERED
jgi:hypothetical protein